MMKELTVNDAFGMVPPRSAAFLCLPGKDGGTDIIGVPWFTWLNTKHNPMLSFSLDSREEMGERLQNGESLYLAFPESKPAAEPQKTHLPPEETAGELPVRWPEGACAVFCCKLANKYKYPFKKVRIFNCDLDTAYSLKEE